MCVLIRLLVVCVLPVVCNECQALSNTPSLRDVFLAATIGSPGLLRRQPSFADMCKESRLAAPGVEEAADGGDTGSSACAGAGTGGRAGAGGGAGAGAGSGGSASRRGTKASSMYQAVVKATGGKARGGAGAGAAAIMNMGQPRKCVPDTRLVSWDM
jgi:hypothetical protein